MRAPFKWVSHQERTAAHSKNSDYWDMLLQYAAGSNMFYIPAYVPHRRTAIATRERRTSFIFVASVEQRGKWERAALAEGAGFVRLPTNKMIGRFGSLSSIHSSALSTGSCFPRVVQRCYVLNVCLVRLRHSCPSAWIIKEEWTATQSVPRFFVHSRWCLFLTLTRPQCPTSHSAAQFLFSTMSTMLEYLAIGQRNQPRSAAERDEKRPVCLQRNSLKADLILGGHPWSWLGCSTHFLPI